ncbi:hypothetical protein O3M35_009366 [Rhynocoris fuscipes]|uniref:Uncharacterized protein n=1 Tax=Rhynocoris fuscipes TaxID=488301 RepID=A0AAW1D3H1_9HEMI
MTSLVPLDSIEVDEDDVVATKDCDNVSIDGDTFTPAEGNYISEESCTDSLYDKLSVAKELTKRLSSEREQRQCSFLQLWNHCYGKSFLEKMGIYCDWIYANVNAKLALFGTSTIVPLFAWFTKIFWQAFVIQFIILVILGLFVRYMLRQQIYRNQFEADQLDKKLYQRSLIHMEKMAKINENDEIEASTSCMKQ